MLSVLKRLPILAGLLATLVAPTASVVQAQATPVAQATPTIVQLPDGSVCQWHGSGTAPVFNGQPANYNCDGNGVILGNPTLQNGVWVVNHGVLTTGPSGTSLQSTDTIEMDIVNVVLVDGSICEFTGKGAGNAVNGQRINYTCGTQGNVEVVLIGDFNTSNPAWTATRARITGAPGSYVINSQDTPTITRVVGEEPTDGAQPTSTTTFQLPDGNLCTWQQPTQAQQFNGQPVTYTCSANNTVIVGAPTFQNGTYTISTAVMTQVSGTFQFQSPSTLTVDITHVDLVDGIGCDFTGKGAGAAVNGQRINYTCGSATNPQTVLIGDFNVSAPLWTAMRARITGDPSSFVVQSQDQAGIAKAITANATSTPGGATSATAFQLPDGTQCTRQTPTAAQQFNGQPANYTCATNNQVILGVPTFTNGVWTINTAVMTQSGSSVQFQSPTTLTVDIVHVDLVDGVGCDFAGKGATAAINGQRINYTCPPSGGSNVALIGDFNTSAPLWTATRARYTGTPDSFNVQSQDTPGIAKALTATATPTPGGALGPTPQAPALAHDSRYFNETKFRIDNDAFYNYFTSRGGTETFGFPVSRQFGFLGCQVQIFQRLIMQQCGDNAPVALLNLLDPEIFPYTKVNGSTFPAADESIKNRTPQAGTPGYDQAIIQFIQQTAPDQYNGQPVNFYETFTDTGGLEIWGAVISNPAPDPGNANFIYQRFQRGIMHYTVGQGTRGILLADYLKAIILGPAEASLKGANLPPDLDSAARGSAQYSQYCPTNTRWLCRPNDLPGSDLTFAFETG